MMDARIVANEILDRAESEGLVLTNLDLQKIIYFMHGHSLCEFGRPLVEGEFEAWNFGPVHKTVYDAFKAYNDSPIDGRAEAFDPIRRQRKQLPPLANETAQEVLDQYLGYYLRMPTYMLVEITHGKNTPWQRTVAASIDKPNLGMRISNDAIMHAFEGVVVQ